MSIISIQELASHGSEQDAQLYKLVQELAEYKAESKELKNQDGTIRRLEERVRSLDAQVQEKVAPHLKPLILGFLSVSNSTCRTGKLHRGGSSSVVDISKQYLHTCMRQ